MAIEDNREDADSIEKAFLKGYKASGGVSKDFHTLDYQNHFIGIEDNMLMKQQFSVKDEAEIFPSVFGLQNWATNV